MNFLQKVRIFRVSIDHWITCFKLTSNHFTLKTFVKFDLFNSKYCILSCLIPDSCLSGSGRQKAVVEGLQWLRGIRLCAKQHPGDHQSGGRHRQSRADLQPHHPGRTPVGLKPQTLIGCLLMNHYCHLHSRVLSLTSEAHDAKEGVWVVQGRKSFDECF